MRKGAHLMNSNGFPSREAVERVRNIYPIGCRVELIYDGGVTPEVLQAVRDLFAREEIVIRKRTKRKAMADVDIRPLIRGLDFAAEGDTICIDAVVAAQNPGLNPALLAAAVGRHLPHMTPDFVRARRTALLDGEGKPTSLVADFSQLPAAVEAALEGRQMQPLLLG